MAEPCVVLVVDDNRADSQMVREALDFVGFDGVVVAVENVPQAFAYLSGRGAYATVPKPHLIMLDLNMPVMSGFDMLRELRARPELRSIPVLVFSSSRVPADAENAQRLGAKRFIVKPLDWDGYVGVALGVREDCCAG